MNKHRVPFESFPSIRYSNGLVKLYVDASARMTYSYLLLYSILIPTMSYFISTPLLLLWSLAAFSHIIFRRVTANRLKTEIDADNGGQINKYLRWSIYVAAGGGLLWGSLSWLSFLYVPYVYHYISMSIILGVAAAAIATLSMVFVSYIAFLVPMMILQIATLVILGQMADLVVASMVVVYFIVIIPTARLVYLRTKESFELSETLSASQQELAVLNATLEERVEENTKALQHSYYHDQLTGLSNLKSLAEVLEEKENNYIILFDIKAFSLLNKQYGKDIADKVLISVAELLEKHMHEDLSLFKGESDRFVVYSKQRPLDVVTEYVKLLISFFESSLIEVDGFDINITFNVGISNVSSLQDSLIHAEYALMLAKQNEEHYFIYDITKEELLAEQETINFMAKTKEIILNEDIYPVFQPIYDINQEKIVKYECLARGELDGEELLPYRFLESAARLGLTKNITHLMLEKCFNFFEDNEVHFSINITGSDLLNEHFINILEIKLRRYKIDPSRVTFEVLENITTHSSRTVLNTLQKIKELGCQIAIDDFGVEHSNFSRLLEIDLDLIKIDGLFIKNIQNSEKDKKVVQAMVGLARTLGVKTVAEYVENVEILKILKECGIDYAQGYYIGKPEKALIDTPVF